MPRLFQLSAILAAAFPIAALVSDEEALAADFGRSVSPSLVSEAANRWELRVGGFAHGIGSHEKGTADLSVEIVTPRLPVAVDHWSWTYLVPRLHAGANINASGKTHV